jgi:hypothetical protein
MGDPYEMMKGLKNSWSAVSAKNTLLSHKTHFLFGFSLKCSQDLSLSLSLSLVCVCLSLSLPPLQQTRLTQQCFPHFGLLFVGARSIGPQVFFFLGRCTNLAAQGQIMLWKLWPNLGGCVFLFVGGDWSSFQVWGQKSSSSSGGWVGVDKKRIRVLVGSSLE